MVESPRLAGRDIRTLLCAPQPSRDGAACGRKHIARDAPEALAERPRTSAIGWRALAALLAAVAACIRLWTSRLPSRAVELAPGGSRPPPPRRAEKGQPAAEREAAYVARLDQIVAPLQDYSLSADDNTKLNAAFKALASGDVDEGANDTSQRQRSARPHAHRMGAAAPRQGSSRRLPQVPVGEPGLAEPRATAAAHGRDAVRGRRRHRHHRHLLHRPRSTQPRRHGRARLGAHRARREGASEGSGGEDLAREGSAG